MTIREVLAGLLLVAGVALVAIGLLEMGECHKRGGVVALGVAAILCLSPDAVMQ